MKFDLSDPLIEEAARELDQLYPECPIAPPKITVSMKRVLPQGWSFDERTLTYHDAISGQYITEECMFLKGLI